MKFKDAVLLNVEPNWDSTVSAEDALDAARFAPCAPSQESSSGWVPPRGHDNGPLIEIVAGHWIVQHTVESKTIPAAALRRKVDERAAEIEKTTGRAPGKKERKQLKEDITHEMLPQAISKISSVQAWIDPVQKRLVVGSGSWPRVDSLVTALVQSVPGFAVSPIHTKTEPASMMAGWLATHEPAEGFSIDRECELKATDESKAVVRYAKHPLDIDEVRGHIESGKRPTKLAMTWEDRVSFVLTEGMALRKLAFLEGTLDDAGNSKGEDSFDADVAIVTGELGQLIPALLQAHGGELVMGQVGGKSDGE